MALMAQLAVPNVDPLWTPINEPVNDPVFTVNVIDVAADAVVAKEELRAYDAEVADATVPPMFPAAT